MKTIIIESRIPLDLLGSAIQHYKTIGNSKAYKTKSSLIRTIVEEWVKLLDIPILSSAEATQELLMAYGDDVVSDVLYALKGIQEKGELDE